MRKAVDATQNSKIFAMLLDLASVFVILPFLSEHLHVLLQQLSSQLQQEVSLNLSTDLLSLIPHETIYEL